jgi:hypothetical protein
MDLLGFFTGRWPEGHPFAQITATAADELMITTMVYDPAARLRSFELVADIARASHPAASSIAP